ncbi:putative general secretory pathway protein K precursor [Bradyrhizobium sp. STM 3843]|uniref:general secretion pathway protein GspK n=1 Tax=Bradyrhizobium sp. STM 3843 TaxID=551947 RepID=UPI0002407147|nr:type II secretion system protein GspK [Bradyrhizobium sp. STM 3843]CCE06485.1 putative general secretory pathway protein K precursor [Bradyrhizobium sp. STM 3843]
MVRRTDVAACHRHRAERGFVLVAVLWIIAALAALATIFSAFLANSARAIAVNDNALQAEALVSAAVELTAYKLASSGESPPAHGAFHARLNGAEMSISFTSETARIDLNNAPKELLSGLMTVLGAPPENAKDYADRIVGWRTRAAPGSAAGGEDALYRAAGRSYGPRQAPFAHINELALVLGLPPALVERALPFVTVFSGSAGVDVINAKPEVIAALPGMTPLILKQFLADRDNLGNDPQAIARALGEAKASASQDKCDVYRILIRLQKDNWQTASEVVIGLKSAGNPYRVLAWRDGIGTIGGREL